MRSSTDVKTKLFIVYKIIIIFKQMKVVVVGGCYLKWILGCLLGVKIWKNLEKKKRVGKIGVENIMSIVWGG